MLVAKNEAGDIVSLLSLSKEELQHQRTQSYYCPCCQQKVCLKVGSIKIPHFAHISNLECHGVSEGETKEHLTGKKHFYEWLSRQGYDVEIEKYFPDFHQRADLYFIHDSQAYAIEFQCSPISLEQLTKRTSMYRQFQIEPIWIFSNRFLKRKRDNTFSFSSIHSSVMHGNALVPLLFFYGPFEAQWTILSLLTPFSARQFISIPLQTNLHNLTFTKLFQVPTSFAFPIQDWLYLKQKWRLQSSHFAQSNPSFFNALYRTRLYPATFPHEIGIPVPYSYFFETSAIEWQFWLYEEVLLGKSPGSFVSLQQWKTALFNCIRDKRIVLRIHRHQEVFRPFLPVQAYVWMLVQLDVLKPIAKGKYILNRLVENFNPEEPNQEKEFYKRVAASYDRAVMGFLNSLNERKSSK